MEIKTEELKENEKLKRFTFKTSNNRTKKMLVMIMVVFCLLFVFTVYEIFLSVMDLIDERWSGIFYLVKALVLFIIGLFFLLEFRRFVLLENDIVINLSELSVINKDNKFELDELIREHKLMKEKIDKLEKELSELKK